MNIKHFTKVKRDVAGGWVTWYILPKTKVRLSYDDAKAISRYIEQQKRSYKSELIKREKEIYKIHKNHAIGIKLMADEIREVL